MYYRQFQKALYKAITESEVKNQTLCYSHTIVETVDGEVLVDGNTTLFVSLEEAVDNIKQQQLQKIIQQQIQEEVYNKISNNKIVSIIKEHHGDVKVTDTLVESYVELASSKIFTTNAVAYNIRKVNNFGGLVEGKIDFKLDDGSTVLVHENTFDKINNIFGQHDDIINYMRASAENFLSVVDQIGE